MHLIISQPISKIDVRDENHEEGEEDYGGDDACNVNKISYENDDDENDGDDIFNDYDYDVKFRISKYEFSVKMYL